MSRRKKSDEDGCVAWLIVAVLIAGGYVLERIGRAITGSTDGGHNLIVGGAAVIVIALVLSLLTFIANQREQQRRRIAERRRLRALQLADVDQMTGIDFEHYVGALLTDQGFQVQLTMGSGDFGVDVIAEQGDEQWAVQCKRRKSPVSLKAVQEAVAGKDYYGCSAAMVVTNNYFTQSARALARSAGCKLINRDALADWILDFQTAHTAGTTSPTETLLDKTKAIAIAMPGEITRERVAWVLGWLVLAIALFGTLFLLRDSPRQIADEAYVPTPVVAVAQPTSTHSNPHRTTVDASNTTRISYPTYTPRPMGTPVPTRQPNPTSTPWAIPAVVTARGLNVREGPGVDYQPLGAVGQGTELVLDGRNRSGTWVHGRAPDEDLEGWLSAGYVKIHGDVMTLPVVGVDLAGKPQATASTLRRPTSTPEPRATVVGGSIGVTRADVQSFFEKPELGFEFRQEGDVRGQPQFWGMSPSEVASIQLLGPPENLVRAAIMIFVNSDDPTEVMENSAYLIFFLKKAVPGWEEGVDWVETNLSTLGEGRVKTTHENVDIILEATEVRGVGIVSVAVEPSN